MTKSYQRRQLLNRSVTKAPQTQRNRNLSFMEGAGVSIYDEIYWQR